MIDVPSNIPLVPCVLEWTTGERIIVRDDEGLPKMVPIYDPMLEAFVTKHDHDLPDKFITHADMIQVIQVDQRTWRRSSATRRTAAPTWVTAAATT
jgi:hypothetical protein